MVARGKREQGKGVTQWGQGLLLVGDENVLKLDNGDSSQTLYLFCI